MKAVIFVYREMTCGSIIASQICLAEKLRWRNLILAHHRSHLFFHFLRVNSKELKTFDKSRQKITISETIC